MIIYVKNICVGQVCSFHTLQSGYNGTITSYKMYFSKRYNECCGFDVGDSGVGRSVDKVWEEKQMKCVILMPKF